MEAPRRRVPASLPSGPGRNIPPAGNLQGIDPGFRVIDSVAFFGERNGGDMKLNNGFRTALVACALVPAVMVSARKHEGHKPAKTLYIWAGDQARVAPDFLSVIDFDQDSPGYGRV